MRTRANAAGYGNAGHAAFLAEQNDLQRIAEHRGLEYNQVDPGDRIPEEEETVLRLQNTVRDALASTKTKGKSQILVDVGSNVNVAGERTLKIRSQEFQQINCL